MLNDVREVPLGLALVPGALEVLVAHPHGAVALHLLDKQPRHAEAAVDAVLRAAARDDLGVDHDVLGDDAPALALLVGA